MRRPESAAGPKYGDIWIADLEPSIGAEIGKRRPVLVVSNDQSNRLSRTITVLPLSTQRPRRRFIFEVTVPAGAGGVALQSRVKANLIQTISELRLIRLLGVLPASYFPDIERAIRIHLNMAP